MKNHGSFITILHFFLLQGSLLASKGIFDLGTLSNTSMYSLCSGIYVFFAKLISSVFLDLSQYFNSPAKIFALSLVIATISCLLLFLGKNQKTKDKFKSFYGNSFEYSLTFTFYAVFWMSCSVFPFIFGYTNASDFLSQITSGHLKIFACTTASLTATMIFVFLFIFFAPKVVSYLTIGISIVSIFLAAQNLSLSLFSLAVFSFFAILVLSFIAWYIPKINRISHRLKDSASILIKNLSAILPTLLFLNILFHWQFTAILIFTESLSAISERSKIFLGLFLVTFSFFILINFITVFVSSKTYNSYSSGNTSFMFSLKRAISAMFVLLASIVLLAFFFSWLKTLENYIESLIANEGKKAKANQNVWYLLGLSILNIILGIIIVIYSQISEFYLIAVGIYGPDVKKEELKKTSHLIFDEDLIAVRASQFNMVLYLISSFIFASIFLFFNTMVFNTSLSLNDLSFLLSGNISKANFVISKLLDFTMVIGPMLLMFVPLFLMFDVSIISGIASRRNNVNTLYQ